MNEQISDRRKRGKNKQTNKQILTLERQTRAQAVISWKGNTPEGVVWGNLKKKEDQEELVGDGTDVQTFLIYLHPPSRFWDESWHFVLFACGLLLFLVRYSCCRAGRRSPVEQHPSVTVSLFLHIVFLKVLNWSHYLHVQDNKIYWQSVQHPIFRIVSSVCV